MNTEVPAYEEVKAINFWVPPQPGSLMLSVTTSSGKEVKIDMLPDEDDAMDDTLPDIMRMRSIYIDNKPVELKSEEETKVIALLSALIENDRLGHKQGLAVHVAKEMIEFFST